MIKFFRRIRQNLLSENKFSKYLIYAIGEIILVVIGILIALSINNWNESRKTRLQDFEFLNNLKVELSIDIAALTTKISEYQRINSNISNTVSLFNTADNELTPDEHQVIVSALTQFQVFTPINKNINRNDLIIAQGTIDRIDPELNRKFLTYLEETQSINAVITNHYNNLKYSDSYVDYDNMLKDQVDFDYKEILIMEDMKCIT